MFTSQRKEREDPQIIAIVELDMQKLRLQIVWAREAIRERLRELGHPGDHHGEGLDFEDAPLTRSN
jgi:hypothetical protein